MISSANKNQKNYKCIWPIYSRATKVYFSCWASCSYECSMQNGWTKVTAVLCFPLCDSCQCRCTAWRGRWDWELYSLCSWREWTGRYIIILRITRGCLATQTICKQNPLDIVPRKDYDYKSSVDIANWIRELRQGYRPWPARTSLRTSKHLSATEALGATEGN